MKFLDESDATEECTPSEVESGSGPNRVDEIPLSPEELDLIDTIPEITAETVLSSEEEVTDAATLEVMVNGEEVVRRKKARSSSRSGSSKNEDKSAKQRRS